MKIHLELLYIAFCLINFFLLITGRQSKPEKCEITDYNHKCKLPETMARKFSMPKLFRFDLFVKKYTRHWDSIEEMARRKIYLGRAIQVFIIAILYKHRKSDSYIGINHFSDRTPKELEIMMMITSMLELSDSKSGEKGGYLENGVWDQIPLADPEDIEQELEKIRKHSSESGYKEMAEELGFEVPGKSRAKRDVDARDYDRKSLHLDDLVKFDDKQRDISEEKQNKSATFFGRIVNLLPTKLAKIITKASKFSLFDYIIKKQVLKSSNSQAIDVSDSTSSQLVDDTKLPDEVYIDHRESKCFFSARDQGYCASCYAFAAVALHEWANCKATGELVAFSEQYIIDCGSSFNSLLQGCQGGSVARVGEFVNNFGLELRDDYPYIARAYQCPYSAGTPPKEMGLIRISYHGPETGEFSLDKIEFYLQYSPILIGMKVNRLFTGYAGGVDLALDCKEENGAHAVLIVGSGRQNGEEYWLIRNSFSTDWGEDGYYKLNKRANCFLSGKGFLSRPIFKPNHKENRNPDYNGSKIHERRQIYAIYEAILEQKLKLGKNAPRHFKR